MLDDAFWFDLRGPEGDDGGVRTDEQVPTSANVIYRTADEPQRGGTELLRHVVCEAIGLLELRPPRDEHSGILRMTEMGGLRATEAQMVHNGSDPCSQVRNARHIRQQQWQQKYRVDIPLEGRMAVSQDGRDAQVNPGELTVTDLTRPSGMEYFCQRVLTLVVPQALIPVAPEEVVQVTARPLGGANGALTIALARHMLQIGPNTGADGVRLTTALLDMLAVTVAARSTRPAVVYGEAAQRALLTTIYAFIEERLGDPDLAPPTIATAHHVSERYLYRLFETEGNGVAGWIRRRRLEQCRRDLLDPRLAERPVAAIAARWGIANPAHFNRIFKAEFGMTPGELRRSR